MNPNKNQQIDHIYLNKVVLKNKNIDLLFLRNKVQQSSCSLKTKVWAKTTWMGKEHIMHYCLTSSVGRTLVHSGHLHDLQMKVCLGVGFVLESDAQGGCQVSI